MAPTLRRRRLRELLVGAARPALPADLLSAVSGSRVGARVAARWRRGGGAWRAAWRGRGGGAQRWARWGERAGEAACNPLPPSYSSVRPHSCPIALPGAKRTEWKPELPVRTGGLRAGPPPSQTIVSRALLWRIHGEGTPRAKPPDRSCSPDPLSSRIASRAERERRSWLLRDDVRSAEYSPRLDMRLSRGGAERSPPEVPGVRSPPLSLPFSVSPATDGGLLLLGGSSSKKDGTWSGVRLGLLARSHEGEADPSSWSGEERRVE